MRDDGRRHAESAAGTLLVWDADGVPEAGFWRTVLWRSFDSGREQSNRCISIPRLVEETADQLRSQYLAWVFALGEAKVGGKSVTEHLLIRPQLSFWWLGSVAQKYSISATSLVPDAIKMLALEKLILGDGVKSIVLYSDNGRLAECLGEYCRHGLLAFEWRRASVLADVQTLRKSVYGRLPAALRALISFGWFCVSRLSTAFRKLPKPAAEAAYVSFFDVLIHLDKRAYETGRFVSNYWGLLVDKLFDSGIRTNWFHFFHPQPAIPTMAKADRLVRRFQQSAGGRQSHSIVDALPPIGTLLRAVRDYVRLQRVVGKLDGFQNSVRPERSVLNLWPLHMDEWRESLTGPNALMECIRLGLFEDLLAGIPRQRVGVYICENQPWEMSLISAWRRNGHGDLIAAPHTTIRYWDLRYFHDPRSYVQRGEHGLPMPDHFAVNGLVAKMTALAGGYPVEKVVEVEALRFMHLAAIADSGRTAIGARRVLVCGDFLSATNDRIFDWLGRAAESLSGSVDFVFKPHPAFPYSPDAGLVCRLGLLVDERPLPALLPDCDVVVTSAITSAAVDAYCAGKQVVQILDGGGLNANALRGMSGVLLAGTPGEFLAALQEAPAREPGTSMPYFLLDPALQKWWRVMGLDMTAPDFQSSTKVITA